MDPLWHPTSVVPVVSTVTVGMVVSTAMRMVGVMVGVSSAGVPRCQQHLEMSLSSKHLDKKQIALLAEALNYSDVVNWR